MVNLLWGLGGMAGLLLIAFALSSNRRAIRLRTVIGALALQVGFGVLVLYWGPGQWALGKVSAGFQAVIDTSAEGISFLFGPLIPADGEGSVFALQVLPVIIFFASLTAVLYHWKILPKVVSLLGGGLGKLLGTGYAESVNAAANIFVGQTEAPLVIRPYIKRLSRSGLFAVMVGGLSTVAGSVLVGYSLLGAPLEYLIAASFMAAPGALLMAKILLPEDDPDALAREAALVEASSTRSGSRGTQTSRVEGTTAEAAAPPADAARATDIGVTDGGVAKAAEDAEDAEAPEDVEDTEDDLEEMQYSNVIDAAAGGAADGLKLAATVGAMLLAFISLIALINLLLGTVGGWFGAGDLTFQQILGWVFAPVMAMIGVPWNEAVSSGSFVGQKVVVNEFVAFAGFGPQIDSFSPKTAAITTFALTGFANLSSLGILLGGLGGLAPSRRSEIAQLGLKAILGGTLANLMSAAIAGVLLG
ncbi:NupC/NupG family nucleoside CNT transporter [Brachybacterium alimentarium]|uniref:NupC/NupG family nucleoside CNT transporter n=1 Tax=Brachybacterium alimentarium TaxID=47845 RepID=UPI000BB6D653|nr:nucleoside transporter C-terminal domain-containing protein [Brachybacterium alimentarium]PCC32086.1 nucleoside transporter [Brachybacterium alimentarium]RCS71505.1 NupC/NupG family nucleoside CNT transporter [Brachybacterium alimentarium]RCS92107.1 NupC/NupG family nucleoside CNT transporter [Brachybacterium alimentarium]